MEISAGKGIKAQVGRDRITVGNLAFMQDEGIDLPSDKADASGTHCYVAKNGKYIGTIVVSDKPKENPQKTQYQEMIESRS